MVHRHAANLRLATLPAIPTRLAVPKNTSPAIEVAYAGEPKFEPITNTNLQRAVNTSYDVIQFQGQFYLGFSGIWYVGPAPRGPWLVAEKVPDEIYAIPPGSPTYHVTQVTIKETSSDAVLFSYMPAYVTGVYVAYGIPYCGTGWYYPPYVYGRY